MYFLRFRQYALKWDLPERFVAGIGIATVTTSAILAGASLMFNEKVGEGYGLDTLRHDWLGFFSLTTIGVTYLIFMMGTAWFLASKPRDGKPIAWLTLSTALTLLFLAVASELFFSLFRGMRSVY